MCKTTSSNFEGKIVELNTGLLFIFSTPLSIKGLKDVTKKPLPIKGMDHPDNCQILSATENMEKGNKFRPVDQLLFLERMNFLKPLTNKNFYEELSIKKKNV